MIGGRKEPKFMNYDPSKLSERDQFREEFYKWYIQTHHYITNRAGRRFKDEKYYGAWIELQYWLPVMEPKFECSEAYKKYGLS